LLANTTLDGSAYPGEKLACFVAYNVYLLAVKRASLFSRQALPFGGIESPFLMSDFLNLFHFEIFNQILFFSFKNV
jgi:hypothetical protein